MTIERRKPDILHLWEEFYFNMVSAESHMAITGETGKNVDEEKPICLDSYTCLETFSPSVLVQVGNYILHIFNFSSKKYYTQHDNMKYDLKDDHF